MYRIGEMLCIVSEREENKTLGIYTLEEGLYQLRTLFHNQQENILSS